MNDLPRHFKVVRTDRELQMPTVDARLREAGAQLVLLADGHGSDPGFGELMVVEVGGATINVHSVASTKPGTRDTVITPSRNPSIRT